MRKRQIIACARRAFFGAMLAGYAGNGAVQRNGSLSWTDYVDDAFNVVDCWETNCETGFLFGTITISHEDGPVWFMHYSGHYPEEVIPLLKQALLQNYRRNRFFGGRGPRSLFFRKEGYVYRNTGERTAFDQTLMVGFEAFAGTEKFTRDSDGVVVGYHHYRGGLMI